MKRYWVVTVVLSWPALVLGYLWGAIRAGWDEGLRQYARDDVAETYDWNRPPRE